MPWRESLRGRAATSTSLRLQSLGPPGKSCFTPRSARNTTRSRFSLAGLVLLAGYRLAALRRTGLAEPAFHCANALMSLSLAAAALLTLSRMATQLADLHLSWRRLSALTC